MKKKCKSLELDYIKLNRLPVKLRVTKLSSCCHPQLDWGSRLANLTKNEIDSIILKQIEEV